MNPDWLKRQNRTAVSWLRLQNKGPLAVKTSHIQNSDIAVRKDTVVIGRGRGQHDVLQCQLTMSRTSWSP